MNLRAEDYRRQALQVKQRAAQITDPRLKEAFQDIARHWLPSELGETSIIIGTSERTRTDEPETSAGETSGRLPRART
jgi:hypothetical protein